MLKCRPEQWSLVKNVLQFNAYNDKNTVLTAASPGYQATSIPSLLWHEIPHKLSQRHIKMSSFIATKNKS